MNAEDSRLGALRAVKVSLGRRALACGLCGLGRKVFDRSRSCYSKGLFVGCQLYREVANTLVGRRLSLHQKVYWKSGQLHFGSWQKLIEA